MNTYKGEPTSVLRKRLMELIDRLEESEINDDAFINGVYYALGRIPPVEPSIPYDDADWMTDIGADWGPYGY